MALTLTSVSPEIVPYDGGHLIELRGAFGMNVAMNVYLGLTGTTSDAQCYSGIPGQGSTIYALTTGYARAYTPAMTVSSAMHVLMVAPSVPESDLLSAALEVVVSSHALSVFSMRSLFAPIYKVGPRSMGALPPLLGS